MYHNNNKAILDLTTGWLPQYYHVDAVLPPARSYRRSMKPRLSRKATSAARINLNRFWNELEDFYARQDESRCGGMMPAYTTDVFDHEREAAENEANERLESISCVDEDEELEMIQDLSQEKGHTRMLVSNKHSVMSDVARQTLRDRLQSQDILDLDYLDDDDVCSSGSSSTSSSSSSRCASPQLLALWNVLESSSSPLPSPPPPKSLVDIVSIVAQRLA